MRWPPVFLMAAASSAMREQLVLGNGIDKELTGSNINSTPFGKLPVLGWNSWNAYGCNVSEAKILDAAHALVELGLKEAGYKLVGIDDCWSVQSGRDSKTKRLLPDLTKFPDGINGTAKKVHALDLLIGIYSSAGTKTCAGYPASLSHELLDAETWRDWKIDFLKYDNCNVPKKWQDSCSACDRDSPNAANGTCTSTSDKLPLCDENYNYATSNTSKRFKAMGDALTAQEPKRTIVYSLCEWGRQNVWEWGSSRTSAVSWRTTNDIKPNWPRILSILNQNSFLSNYVTFWKHNDMDMLEVGNGQLTYEENRSHFALWASLKSPLLIGTDLRALKQELLDLLTNRRLLQYSQDTQFGEPAKPYKWGTNPNWTFNASFPAEYWAGPSSNGTMVLILNTDSKDGKRTADWSEVPGLDAGATYLVVDAWTGKSQGCHKSSYTVTVKSHDTAVLQVLKQGC